MIVWERRGHRDAERRLGDRNVDVELGEQRVQAAVELGNREAVDQWERSCVAVIGVYHQGVVDEVEVDLEADIVGRVHAAGGETAHVDVEGYVPPMVSGCARRHPDLAHDLCPQVQRLLGWLPLFER